MLRPIALAFALSLPAFVWIGCQTLPVQEIPAGADPDAEITATEKMRTDSQANQADVLAPSFFSVGEKKLSRAKDQLRDGDDHQAVLQTLAESRANFAKANNVTNQGNAAIPEVVKARADALAAGAKANDSKHFGETDEILRQIGGDLEGGSTSSATSARKDLATRYSDLELAAIREKHLGRAERLYGQAVKEGATLQAPRTLATAKTTLDDAEKYLTENRHDEAGITARAATATDASNRLLLMVRDTKDLSREDAESLVLERERAQQNLDTRSTELKTEQDALAAAKGRESQLQDEKAFNDRFADAKARFTAAEADVYRQGNGLVMRLRGLVFANGKAEVSEAQRALLDKVRDVANLFAPAVVNIEGHTDAVGSAANNMKLAEARAQAVQDYLLRNGASAKLKVNAEGFGDSRPLASNKNAAGRAQNRRVDVIVIPENTPAASH